MPIRYLYVDDDETEKLEELIAEVHFHAGGELEITHTRTNPMKVIQQMFVDGRYDGLMIDQKLDAANEDGVTADYWGTALAQNFRTEMIGGQIENAPIVLFSNEDVYVQYFDKDESAHNLFDFTLGKTALSKSERYAYQASHILIGLAKAYNIARSQVQPLISSKATRQEVFAPLLAWDDSIFKFIDKRFLECAEAKSHDIHTLISLILNTLVRSAGMLVTESMLTTRLGIDVESSSDWSNLKAQFESFKYSGVFASLKERWWFSRIEDWWYENEVSSQSMRGLTATERVDAIKQITGFQNLKPILAKYTNGQQSEKYWVNCVVSETPLDPYDAILVSKPDLKPWEQPLYLDAQITYDREYSKAKYPVHSDYQKKVRPLYNRLTNND